MSDETVTIRTGRTTEVNLTLSLPEIEARITELDQYDRLTRAQADDLSNLRAARDQKLRKHEEIRNGYSVSGDGAGTGEAQAARQQELDRDYYARNGGQPGGIVRDAHPLAVTGPALDGIQAALQSRSAGRIEARTALATTTYGAPTAWGSNVLAGPRLLHMVAGIPQQRVNATSGEFPQLTLPTAAAGVGENTTVGEYDDSTAGTVTLLRFGRFTDVSRESLVGADAGALTAAHRVGIALDLDLALIGPVEDAAGTPVVFGDPVADVRTAMASVIATTAAADVSDLVILVHPDNAALLQDVTPIGGRSIAEPFQRFGGAIVYASTAVETGFVTVANLKAGARYFEAVPLVTELDNDIKTGTQTIATWTIGGYGLGLVDGFAVQVDVVA